MRNYLKAELFRNFHRRYLWIYIACLVGCGILGCICCKYINVHYSEQIPVGEHITVEKLMKFGVFIMPAYSFLMMLFADISIGEEIKNNTIKNIVSSGLTRGKIYVCKLMESIILMVFSTTIIFCVIILMGYMILGSEGSIPFRHTLQECLSRGSIAMLLCSGAIALSMVLLVILKNGTIANFVYLGIILLGGDVFSFLGHYIHPIFTQMQRYLIRTQLDQVAYGEYLSVDIIIEAISVGILSMVIISILGNGVLKRKDI